jgi:hypothetical protein
MPVSSGLQKYFDSQQKKKSQGDVKKKFQDLASQVDPAFMASFESFHDRILDIVDENPEAQDMVIEEIGELDMKLQNSNRVHNMKKASSIISSSENA